MTYVVDVESELSLRGIILLSTSVSFGVLGATKKTEINLN